jgi:sigma-B regulation protein RsbU (phosphoserine phosphatase)
MTLILLALLNCFFLALIFFLLWKSRSRIAAITQANTPVGSSPFSEKDVSRAIALQKHLLPKTPSNLSHFELATIYQPAQYLSGDFYDFHSFSNQRLGILIADVAGKGLPAALVMTLALTHFRYLAPSYTSPAELLKEMNQRLSNDCYDNLFVTACYAIIDFEERRLTLARAGHEVPLHYQHANASIIPLHAPGMALGIDKGDRFDKLIADSVIPLQSGDSVTFFTDGVNETQNSNEEEFGMDRIKQLIASLEKSGPRTNRAQFLLANLMQEIEQFRGSATPVDDLTLITLYVK